MDSLTFVEGLVQIRTFVQQLTVAWYSLRLNTYESLKDTAAVHLSARCSNLRYKAYVASIPQGSEISC